MDRKIRYVMIARGGRLVECVWHGQRFAFIRIDAKSWWLGTTSLGGWGDGMISRRPWEERRPNGVLVLSPYYMVDVDFGSLERRHEFDG